MIKTHPFRNHNWEVRTEGENTYKKQALLSSMKNLNYTTKKPARWPLIHGGK